jgi:signal recognition particle subunit SRP19
MRQQDKVIIWPAYFDLTKTRKDGRRVPKSIAVVSPKILEIKDAVEKLRFDFELKIEAGYSKTPTLKTGMLLVKKKDSKEQTIEEIAKQLFKIRAVAQASQEKKS